MIVDGEALASNAAPADVIVLGAGAVGLPLAVKLARAGLSVILLEAGPATLSAESQAHFDAPRSIGKWNSGLNKGRFRALGGTTHFWGGQLVRIDPHVFAPRPWLGHDVAWPIEHSVVAPYYAESFALLGMDKVMLDDAEVMARLGLPFPTLDPDLGYFFTRKPAELFVPNVFEAELRASPNLRLALETQATALVLDEAGARVTGVEIATPAGPRRLAARHVILANGTIEIARMLSSPLADGREAPWRDNPWLGRGFMDHLDVNAGSLELLDRKRFNDLFNNVVFDGFRYQPKIKLSGEAQRTLGAVDIAAHLIFNSSLTEHLDNAKTFLRSFVRGRVASEWRQFPAALYALLRVGVPMALRYVRHNRVYAHADGSIDLRLTCEHLPTRESRIVATERVDPAGLRVFDLDWRVRGEELATMAAFAEKVGASLEAAGIARLRLDSRLAARDPAFVDACIDSFHHMGMARMGRTPADGVVDPEQRVWGVGNLHVAGAATFPSAGFPNPTLTALALALRLADRLVKETRA